MYKKFLGLVAVLFATSNVYAADLGKNDHRVASAHDWTGLYIGASVGKTEAEDVDEAFPIAPPITIVLESEGESTSVGFHIGYLYQMDQWVVGAEYEYVDIDLQFIGQGLGPLPVYLEDAHMFKAKLGFAVENVLLYGDFGVSHARVNSVAENLYLEDMVYSAGGGIEIALDEKVSVGAEYSHSWFDEFDSRPIEGTMDRISGRISLHF